MLVCDLLKSRTLILFLFFGCCGGGCFVFFVFCFCSIGTFLALAGHGWSLCSLFFGEAKSGSGEVVSWLSLLWEGKSFGKEVAN